MSSTVTTAVEMANLALAHLKEAPLRDLDFSSVGARWFRNHYAAHRDAYLAMHDWDFATSLAFLPAEAERPPFRWRHQYRKPADCLRIPLQTAGGAASGTPVAYEIVGQRLLSDQPPPFPLRYIRRIEREADFPPLFVQGFALFLAAGCAHVLTGKASLADALRQASRKAFETAAAADARQGTPLPMIDLEIVTER